MAALRQAGMLLLDIAEKGKGTLTIPGDQRRSLAVSIPLLQPQPIERPPLPFRLGEGAEIAPPPPATTPQPKDLGDRILEYLQGHGEARTAREIRNACTRSTDDPRASTDDVKALLGDLVRCDYLHRWEDGQTERYQVTGTTPLGG
jgi:hypothetical protein